MIRQNISEDLSEQAVLDCARDSYGCDGGFMDRALELKFSHNLNLLIS